MRKFTAFLLASASVAALPAMAQTAIPAEADASDAEAIIVFGKGETRQVQEVGAPDIVILTPGTSPLKAIEKLPGVNFQSADPFGNYEWSTRVTIRSFNQNQLGFTFDGIPLGDMSYGNHNGLHVSRLVSPENVGSVQVSQGAGSIGTQSTNNLGGTVETFSMDPEARLGGLAAVTYGNEDTTRAFVRLNVGSEDGPRGFVSYGYGSTDKYKGVGKQDQHLVNAKLVVPIGDARIEGWLSWSDRREQDYQDMSLDMLARLGYSSDNLFPDYAAAVRIADIAHNRGETGQPVTNAAAGTVYPGAITSADDAYYDAAGLRKDLVASLGVKAPLGENASLELRGYFHDNKGRGLWGTPYLISPTGAPLSMRTTEYEMERTGLFGRINAKIGNHDVSFGGWYENNDSNQARRFYAFASRTEPGLSFRKYPQNPFFTQWEFDFTTRTIQYFLSDKIDFGALKINLGTKGFKVTNKATAIVQASFPQGRIKVEDWFQPHAGLVYELADRVEMFAGYTQATRSFASATTTGPFSTNQTGFNAIKGTLKPETSATYELG
ncbi:MAG TPA: TonB-dependent receptor, partial [Novosphingobium sp.]|nr:TonB-dependent receptor [Novosphingobium sp.]